MLISLDAYRGFIMLLLVSEGFGFGVLKDHTGWAWLATQADHAAWEGCTFWDLIQPAFTFMVGVAMPFAFASRIAQAATASTGSSRAPACVPADRAQQHLLELGTHRV